MQIARIVPVFVALLVSALAGATLADDAAERRWEGTWNNKKYNTTGPLACVAKPGKEAGTWDATFTGKYKGDPFEYKVSFTAKPMGRQTVLGGNATVSGHKYVWQGAVRGKKLLGEYRSRNGYFGTFELVEKSR